MKKIIKILPITIPLLGFCLLAFFIFILAVMFGADDLGSGTIASSDTSEGTLEYSSIYKSVVNSHLLSSSDTEIKGYVTLYRTKIFYEMLLEQYGIEDTDVDNNKSIFIEAYEMNLGDNGMMISLSEACNKLTIEGSYCTEESIEEIISSGKDSNDAPYSFLIFPLDYSSSGWQISSLFNVQRYIKTETATSIGVHYAWDISAPAQTPIYAACSGTVLKVNNSQKTNTGCGGGENCKANFVEILCDDTLSIDNVEYQLVTQYYHLYPNSITVSAGDSVSQGTQIGGVGTTGNSTGNHLHFGLYIYNYSNFSDEIKSKISQYLDAFYYLNWSEYVSNESSSSTENTLLYICTDDNDNTFYSLDEDCSTEYEYDSSQNSCVTSSGESGYLNKNGDCIVDTSNEDEESESDTNFEEIIEEVTSENDTSEDNSVDETSETTSSNSSSSSSSSPNYSSSTTINPSGYSTGLN